MWKAWPFSEILSTRVLFWRAHSAHVRWLSEPIGLDSALHDVMHWTSRHWTCPQINCTVMDAQGWLRKTSWWERYSLKVKSLKSNDLWDSHLKKKELGKPMSLDRLSVYRIQDLNTHAPFPAGQSCPRGYIENCWSSILGAWHEVVWEKVWASPWGGSALSIWRRKWLRGIELETVPGCHSFPRD